MVAVMHIQVNTPAINHVTGLMYDPYTDLAIKTVLISVFGDALGEVVEPFAVFDDEFLDAGLDESRGKVNICGPYRPVASGV